MDALLHLATNVQRQVYELRNTIAQLALQREFQQTVSAASALMDALATEVDVVQSHSRARKRPMEGDSAQQIRSSQRSLQIQTQNAVDLKAELRAQQNAKMFQSVKCKCLK